MQPQTLAQKARPSNFLGRVASRLAMLLSLNVAMSDAPEVTSRRAMLASNRVAFSAENANANPVKDIAVGFILLGVSVLVALAFWPAITSSVATAVADGNTSDSAGTVLGLIPLILAVGLLV